MSAQPPAGGPGEIVLSITGRDIWEKLLHIEQEVTGLPKRVEDHEVRLREVEARKTVSPAQLWTAVASGLGAIGAASTAITILIK